MKILSTALTASLILAACSSAQAQVPGLTKDQTTQISGSWVKLESTPKDLQSATLWSFVEAECKAKMIDRVAGIFGEKVYDADSYEYLRTIVPNIETITGHMYFAPSDDKFVIIKHGVLSLTKRDIFKVNLVATSSPPWVQAEFMSGRVITENGIDRLEFPFPASPDWMIVPLQRPDGKQVLLAKSNRNSSYKSSGYFMQCAK